MVDRWRGKEKDEMGKEREGENGDREKGRISGQVKERKEEGSKKGDKWRGGEEKREEIRE